MDYLAEQAPALAGAHFAAAHLVPHLAVRFVPHLAFALTAPALALPHLAEEAPQRATAFLGAHFAPAQHPPAVATFPPSAAAVTTADASTRERWEENWLMGVL